MVGNGSPRGRGRGDSWGTWTRACSGSRARSTSTTRCAARPGVAAGGRRHGRRRFHGAPAAILRRKANDPETGGEKLGSKTTGPSQATVFAKPPRPRKDLVPFDALSRSRARRCFARAAVPRGVPESLGHRGAGAVTAAGRGCLHGPDPGAAQLRARRGGRGTAGRAARSPLRGERRVCRLVAESCREKGVRGSRGGSLLFCPQPFDRARCCNALESP